jgi:shikimate kinase
MNGLDRIHSENEAAVLNEFTRRCNNIIANGGSYIARKDALGNVDHTQGISSFETAAALKANVLATIPVHAINDYHLVYGRN